jgi:selenocysteine lyase/cysteine desulfurase
MVLSAATVTPLFAENSIELLTEKLAAHSHLSAEELAKDEVFWNWVRMNYLTGTDIINFNSGGVSPHAKPVQEMVEKLTTLSNYAPSYYMWRVLEKDREAIRTKLAAMAGVDAEEIAINRNTTEGLDTIIFGLNLKNGDEIVHSNFIYPNLNQAWMQREMRDGVVRKIAQLHLPSTDTNALVKAYTDQFTKKTKVVHITHLINWTGQIMPVAEIALEAKKIGAKVIVDGAHSFGHFDFKISDLHCDYFATSLHKWLGAPFGTGMLWMRKALIAEHWALFPGPDPKSDDIRKFENQGTRNIPLEIGINAAIEFHEKIGINRKYERLYFLKQFWVERVKNLPRIKIYCPEEKAFSGALTAFGIEGKTGNDISSALMQNAKIHTTTIAIEGIDACRITPNVFTSLAEMDLLVAEIGKLASIILPTSPPSN